MDDERGIEKDEITEKRYQQWGKRI